ncbi:MFS transporter [Nocardioides dongkuii]|uniref:MFS transporter n=1 Tax=Nocardioides dongkuii TaxID=2760089 RepID=UPI0015FD6D65|nr:MFS transporter [Nocardioides dongkuii]
MTRRAVALVLVGLVLLSLNLRPAAVTVGPVLAELRAGLGLSPVTAGLLTSLPVLAFALFGAFAPTVARRVGVHRTTLIALLALTAGLAGRAAAGGEAAFLALTMLALAGMAVANVLLPSLVKLHFPHRVGPVTALYTTMLSIGLTAALVLTVPISDAFGGWRAGIGAWAVLALVAALPWVALSAHDRHPETPPRRVGFRDVARTRLGWAMALFFGLQSLQAYAVFGWFATLWRDSGWSASAAGALVGLLAATAIPFSLWLPAALARSRDPRRILAPVIGCYPVGYLLLVVDPHALAIPAAILVGVGTATFPLVLTLIGLRARTPEGTGALSAFTQSTGYLVAGIGPFAIGLLHDASDGWTVPLLVLAALTVPQLAVGLRVARPAYVEDQLRLGRGDSRPVGSRPR